MRSPGFAIYPQTPVSFGILATENQVQVTVDTHHLPESMGGNGNCAVVGFSRYTNQLETSSRFKRSGSWILNLKISSAVLKVDTVTMGPWDDLDSIAWNDDDEILLESVSSFSIILSQMTPVKRIVFTQI